MTPFTLAIPDDQLRDLRQRLERTRFPDPEPVDDWSQGIPRAYVEELCTYWRERYDWRATEARLNALPQFTHTIDGVDIHMIHVESPRADARPLLLTHGWPGSILEFEQVIGPLSDPEAHGGSADDPAFHLVIPALPGYGFSGKPTGTGWGVEKIADTWATLMADLGYARFFAQGGDWGSAVTSALGARHPERVAAIHINLVVSAPDPATMDNLTPLEQRGLKAAEFYQQWDSGYSKQQSTRPQTLGYGLADSPAGQLAWVVEKFFAWTDNNGHPEDAVSRDHLIDNVMFYWLTNSAASSARLYWESFNSGFRGAVATPTGCTIFPKEIFQSSRRWAEKRYTNIVYWSEQERGGHFAAFEVPEVYVAEVRACFGGLALEP